jgi:hypothetical protein
MEMKGHARRGVGMVAALVLAVGALGIGIASGQTTGNTYTGCLKAGTLTKVAIGSEPLSPCPSSATEVNWNEVGQAGATNVVTRFVDILDGPGQIDGVAMCNDGEVAVGGGFNAGGNGFQIRTFADHPVADQQGAVPTGWHVAVGHENTSTTMTGRIYVVCASP